MELGPQVQTGVLQHAYLAILIRAEQKATGFSLYPMVIGPAILLTSLIAWFLWDRVEPATPFAFGAMMATLSALALVGLARKDSQMFDPLQSLL